MRHSHKIVDIVTLAILAVLVTTIILVILFVAIWKLNRRNTVITLNKSEIEWAKLECPMCQKKLTAGFALPGRGVIWSDKSEKRPGPLANIGSALDNTISISFRPALNIAWRCKSCELVILDISKMITTNDA